MMPMRANNDYAKRVQGIACVGGRGGGGGVFFLYPTSALLCRVVKGGQGKTNGEIKEDGQREKQEEGKKETEKEMKILEAEQRGNAG